MTTGVVKKRFLTMCFGGNVRSVGLARALKEQHGQEAIAVGHGFVSTPTMHMLCVWADYIMPMQDELKVYVPDQFRAKVRVIDVGPDRYHIPTHPDLQLFFSRITREWAEANWNI